MNRIIILIGLSLSCLAVVAQKPAIDYSAMDTWPIISPRLISNDGNFICYTSETGRTGLELVVQSTRSSWKKVIERADVELFTEDSRYLVYRNGGDSLGLIDLYNDRVSIIPGTRSFKIPSEGSGSWLAYQLKEGAGDLVLRNLAKGAEIRFSNVVNYSFSNTGKVLLVESSEHPAKTDSVSLVWYSTGAGVRDTIYRGGKAINFAFNQAERRLAFLGEKLEHEEGRFFLWYYEDGWSRAKILCDDSSPGMNGSVISSDPFVIACNLYWAYGYLDIPSFGLNDSILFFGVKHPIQKKARDSVDVGARVSIWDCKSAFPLSSADISKREGNQSYLAAIRLGQEGQVSVNTLQTQQDDNTIYLSSDAPARFVVTRQATEDCSHYVDVAVKRYNLYLTSVSDGSRILLIKGLPDPYVAISLTGKYVIWYDWDKRAYFSYNTATAAVRNVSSGISEPLFEESNRPGYPSLLGIAGWLEGDSEVLIKGSRDIWEVDPAGRKASVNLTAPLAHGRRVIFQYMHFDSKPEPIRAGDSLVLSAFDPVSKNSTIVKLGLDHAGAGRMPALGKEICYFTGRYQLALSGQVHPFYPLKARDAQRYLAKRMTATEYPNLYVTSDFRRYTPLTFLAPQKKYNWYTVELLHWTMFDGKTGDGLLYKPENFDSSRKYPMLIYYYEQNSDALNIFLHPILSQGVLNIPAFVSNGYLVFVPDVKFVTGQIGECAYNAIVSAAKYLGTRSWVDRRRIGAQGHSFAGFETDYILTRTNLFAAACSASGPTDLVSMYGGNNQPTLHNLFERGQNRMGALLSQRPDLYIKNSPVFRVENVTTPLLVLHNQKDPLVDWSQAVEWFTGLQRLGKKAWLLSYDGEGHALFKKEDELDFTIRMRQFFDHYLMDAPAPAWMNESPN
jgi:dipeptidyl aminopeptidase/acylaminoacyl peptidase